MSSSKLIFEAKKPHTTTIPAANNTNRILFLEIRSYKKIKKRC
jgi:hypothetical protein